MSAIRACSPGSGRSWEGEVHVPCLPIVKNASAAFTYLQPVGPGVRCKMVHCICGTKQYTNKGDRWKTLCGSERVSFFFHQHFEPIKKFSHDFVEMACFDYHKIFYI